MFLGGLTATGCGQDIQFSDSIDFEFDLFRRGDNLNGPYVVGSSFSICADSARDRQLMGTELRSSDPDVVRLTDSDVDEDGDQVCAQARTLTAGEFDVLVVEDGDVLASASLEVRAPDRVELFAAGPRLTNRDELDVEVTRPQVLAGGTATFQVVYFDGESRLSGNGALQVQSTDDLTARQLGTVMSEDREWLQLEPHAEGSYTLELATPAGKFTELDIDVVGEDAIADVELHGGDETGRDTGDPMVVYAQAVDEDDLLIYGVDYEWSLGGETEDERGDMFRYEIDPSESQELVARRGDLTTAVSISAGEGMVDSSNEVGCSIGGRRGGGWALGMLVIAGLVSRRRRR